ncbi:MAG: hypothetical protein ACOX9R_04795 [Armatimonadota bacterium]|jgi:hypothetical protein
MRRRLTGLLVALAIVCPGGSALADYYHYGVAADEFLGNNSTFWSALERFPEWSSSRNLLRDNLDADDNNRSSGDSVYDDLTWYASNLSAGDVLLFSYFGHGGWTASDAYYPDEGSTPRPMLNDPAPSQPPPYAGDEFFGWSGSTYYLWDDDLTNIFAGFDPGVTVVVVSGACHSGGWVGGSHDIDTSVPANNNRLYAILGAPEQGTGIGVKAAGQEYYEILLTTALVNTLDAYMTMAAWYEAAMAYGESAFYDVQFAWDTAPQPYSYWPSADWIPSAHEATWYSDHWGWQESYLQLRPEAYSTLDPLNEFAIGTPEPATSALILIGLCAIAARGRRGAPPAASQT